MGGRCSGLHQSGHSLMHRHGNRASSAGREVETQGDDDDGGGTKKREEWSCSSVSQLVLEKGHHRTISPGWGF
ncbi:unnamed protein product [Boreogadus saida]